MATLGSIYAHQQEPEPGGARGADLHYGVTVSAEALGTEAGVSVGVPLAIGGLRRADPHGEGAALRVRLPRDFAAGGTLRLRGLGEDCPEGCCGDLYLRIELRAAAPSADYSLLVGLACGVAGAAALLWWLVG